MIPVNSETSLPPEDIQITNARSNANQNNASQANYQLINDLSQKLCACIRGSVSILELLPVMTNTLREMASITKVIGKHDIKIVTGLLATILLGMHMIRYALHIKSAGGFELRSDQDTTSTNQSELIEGSNHNHLDSSIPNMELGHPQTLETISQTSRIEPSQTGSIHNKNLMELASSTSSIFSQILDPVKNCIVQPATDAILKKIFHNYGCTTGSRAFKIIISLLVSIVHYRKIDGLISQHLNLNNLQTPKNQGSKHPFDPTINSPRYIAHNAYAFPTAAFSQTDLERNFLTTLSDTVFGIASWSMINQQDSIRSQLDLGFRTFMLDIKNGRNGTIMSTHEILPYGSFENTLIPISDFLHTPDNKNEKILLLIENINDVAVEDLRIVFNKTNLEKFLPKKFEDWSPQISSNNTSIEAQLFPIITRTWNKSNQSSKETGFARGRTILGNDDKAKEAMIRASEAINKSISMNSDKGYIKVLLLESNYDNLAVSGSNCPLRCAPYGVEQCIEIINHFGYLPFPRIFNFLDNPTTLMQKHLTHCSNDSSTHPYVALDHTWLYDKTNQI
jgi:hypothetical protein